MEISNASSSLSSESSGTLDSVHTKKAKERKSKTADKKDPKIEFQLMDPTPNKNDRIDRSSFDDSSINGFRAKLESNM